MQGRQRTTHFVAKKFAHLCHASTQLEKELHKNKKLVSEMRSTKKPPKAKKTAAAAAAKQEFPPSSGGGGGDGDANVEPEPVEVSVLTKAGQRGALIDCQISLPENGSVAP